MAELLEFILQNKINHDEIVKWLTSSETTVEVDGITYNIPQGQFICYFISFLRDETSRFLNLPTQCSLKDVHKLKSAQKNLKVSEVKNCKAKCKSPEKMRTKTEQKRPRRIQLFTSTMRGNESHCSEDSSSRSIIEHTPPKSADHCTIFKNEMSPIMMTGQNIFYHSPLPSKWNTSSPISSKFNELQLLSPQPNVCKIANLSESYKKDHSRSKYKQFGDFIDLSSFNVTPDNKGNKKKNLNFTSPVCESEQGFEHTKCDKSVKRTEPDSNVFDEKTDFETMLSPTKISIQQVQIRKELVTQVELLDSISTIYSVIINNFLSHNIMLDLHFIISLLVAKDINCEMITQNGFFTSVHNCVYVAVRVLSLIKDVLNMLNSNTCRLLYECTRIECFDEDLKNYFGQLCDIKNKDKNIFSRSVSVSGEFQGNITYQCETDNKQNFPNIESFNSFRKQRDLFFEILHSWELNHGSNGWCFSSSLGPKLKTLLTISQEPVNMSHLARLFRSQLLNSCTLNHQSYDETNDEILQLLPTADMSKINLLQVRLTSSQKRSGPCPVPEFTEHEEFFHDFILHSDSYIFHQHLKDSLCSEILSLNETEFCVPDEHDPDSSFDQRIQRRYLDCLSTLTLLAKFLGFLDFLPYQSTVRYSENILSTQLDIRKNVQPVFDIESCLKKSVLQQKLILTLPWILSYLAMMEQISFRLQIYQDVCLFLIYIYKNLNLVKTNFNTSPVKKMQATSTKHNSLNWRLKIIKRHGQFLLKLHLGWFFNLPHFPNQLFYTFDVCKVRLLDEILEDIVKLKSTSPNTCKLNLLKCDIYKTPDKSSQKPEPEQTYKGLDLLNFIDDYILYTVCPYLNELKFILADNEYSVSNVKYVRPITTRLDSGRSLNASKQLEVSLEENFLHNQSSSTRKAVEFVAERVTSSCVKHLVNSVIPELKKKSLQQVKNLKNELLMLEPANRKEDFDTKLSIIAENCERTIHAECEQVLWKFITERCCKAIDNLLGEDVIDTARDICMKITVKLTGERVINWLQTNLTLSVIQKDINMEGMKYVKHIFDTTSQKTADVVSGEVLHVECTREEVDLHVDKSRGAEDTDVMPLECIVNVRLLIWKVIENRNRNVPTDDIKTVMKCCSNLTRDRKWRSQTIDKTILHLLIDLLFILCVHCEDVMDKSLIMEFISLFRMFDVNSSRGRIIRMFFCQRTLLTLSNNNNPSSLLDKFAELLFTFVECNLIELKSVENYLSDLHLSDDELRTTLQGLLNAIRNNCQELEQSQQFFNFINTLS